MSDLPIIAGILVMGAVMCVAMCDGCSHSAITDCSYACAPRAMLEATKDKCTCEVAR